MNPPALVTSRVDDLVLARIATSRAKPSGADVATALRPFAPTTFDDARWTQTIADAIARTEGTGDAKEAARRFGTTGPLTWKQVAERIVPGLALGVAVTDAKAHKRLKERDQWAAAIVGRALGFWSEGPPPSLASICDALVWRSLGLKGKAKRTPPEIRAHFAGQLLPGATAGAADRTVRLLAASHVGAPRADLRALREALVRRWLCGQVWTTDATATAIPSFAAAVRDAAANATDGVFGGRKVYIRNVWRALRSHPTFGGLALDEFKERLVSAHKAGLVSLVRADLVAAMDPDAVRESETRHLEARYHFVDRGTT